VTEDYEYFENKKTGKTYISRSYAFKDQPDRRMRIAWKVFDSPESHAFALDHGEHVIRVTEGGRQEVVAKFYEDDRKVFTLTIQRFTRESGAPHKTAFSFHDAEIPKLLEFLDNLRLVHFPNEDKINVTDEELQELLLSPEQVRSLIAQNQEAVLELVRSEITTLDLVTLGYRKTQLDRFDRLLNDSEYFANEKESLATTDEGVWQRFFQDNTWVFGYGLTFVHLATLDDCKLEQVVAGASFAGKGKRTDALMKTRGAIEALCFVEIKKHTTALLKGSDPYRPGCWAPSSELSGGVAQVQGTVEMALRQLAEKIEPSDRLGNPTGEALFAYRPRSYLVAGSLDQFIGDDGVNVDKFRSFELYRQNTNRPEIITFDELYNRARFIVEHAES